MGSVVCLVSHGRMGLNQLSFMKQLSLLFLASLLISGCQTSLMLQQHRKELRRLASESTPPEQAFTGLAAVITTVFDEVMTLDNPDQQVNFLRKFAKQKRRGNQHHF